MLNSEIDFASQSPAVKGAFIGVPQKITLAAGRELYKFTEHSLFKPDGTVTPWWSSVIPLNPADPGLDVFLGRADALDVKAEDFARARFAVTKQWNALSGLLRVRLLAPVVGLAGRCSSQAYDNSGAFDNVSFIGGAWQIYIPNLTRNVIVESQ